MGVRRRMELTYEDISPLNDRMVYASLTAYGERGPEAEKTGFGRGSPTGSVPVFRTWFRSPWWGTLAVDSGNGGSPHVRCDVRLHHDGSVQAANHRQGRSGIYVAACQRVLVRQLPWDRRRSPVRISRHGAKPTRVERTWIRHQYPASDERLMVLSMVRTPGQQEEFLEAIGLDDLLRDERFADQGIPHA